MSDNAERAGQFIFNLFSRYYPEQTEVLRGTDKDCFYQNEKILLFIEGIFKAKIEKAKEEISRQNRATLNFDATEEQLAKARREARVEVAEELRYALSIQSNADAEEIKKHENLQYERAWNRCNQIISENSPKENGGKPAYGGPLYEGPFYE